MRSPQPGPKKLSPRSASSDFEAVKRASPAGSVPKPTTSAVVART